MYAGNNHRRAFQIDSACVRVFANIKLRLIRVDIGETGMIQIKSSREGDDTRLI